MSRGLSLESLKEGKSSKFDAKFYILGRVAGQGMKRFGSRIRGSEFHGPGSAGCSLCNLGKVPGPVWELGSGICEMKELEPGVLWL